MPEGPECHHIRDMLETILENKIITKINILGGRYKRHGPPKGYNNLINLLPVTINSVNVKGKFLYWNLTKGYYLWNTLGMTGQWTQTKDKHCHIEFVLDGDTPVYFRDIRNFGTLTFCNQKKEMDKKLKTLGCDILNWNDNLDVITLFRKKPNWTLPKFSMNQNYLSGIGNYLKCEALFQSKISPHRLIKDLTDTDIQNFCQQVRKIAQISYQCKGASFLTYRDPDSNKGKYSLNFLVYGKQTYENYNVKREKTSDGRTTYWVTELQI